MIINKEYTFIYTLSCPINNKVKYIGKSDMPEKRYNVHLRESKKKYNLKNNWIKSLEKKGLKPKLKILDKVLKEDWEFWEKYWIEQFKAWGFSLKNMTKGGDGGDTFSKMSEDYKEKFIKEKLGKFGKKHMASIPVLQLNLNGEIIDKFYGISEASRETNIPAGNITRVCKGQRGTAGGYKWKYKNRESKEYINGHFISIVQIDLDGNIIEIFPSIKEAVIKTNSIQSCISQCIKVDGNQKTHNGYVWEIYDKNKHKK